ncbi:sensor histidine kinase [Massilia sp. DD77]|uniref:sensor histidine kinase n=1 Tax=Massilia sp. DD77 TaxID=3109349 RepID=UPI003000F3AD
MSQAITTSPPPRPRLMRLLEDLRLAFGISALVAVVITLVVGKPALLYEQLVFSVCIGVLAFAVVDGARLLWWDRAEWTARQWLPFIGVMLLAAPLAHYTGMRIGFAIMGYTMPSLRDYPSAGRISMVVLTFGVITAMVVLIRHRDRLRRIRQEHADARLRTEVIERQALQAQLRLLQAQIEPHMLFNTLANLQGLIALDPDRASRMLDQLIQYLRATLGATRSESTTLAQEFAAMEAYLGLMGVRMGERLASRLQLPESLRAVRLPPMLLQPLVENAIIHGLEPKIEGGEIAIAAEARDGLLEITVRDTGLGLKDKPETRGGGVGVATTRERLRAIYGDGAAIVLAPNKPQGAIVRLTLPLETTA